MDEIETHLAAPADTARNLTPNVFDVVDTSSSFDPPVPVDSNLWAIAWLEKNPWQTCSTLVDTGVMEGGNF